MDEFFKNVNWEAYGKSKADELKEQYRITKVHFAQCSTSLSFDEFLKNKGFFKKNPNTGSHRPSEPEASEGSVG